MAATGCSFFFPFPAGVGRPIPWRMEAALNLKARTASFGLPSFQAAAAGLPHLLLLLAASGCVSCLIEQRRYTTADIVPIPTKSVLLLEEVYMMDLAYYA